MDRVEVGDVFVERDHRMAGRTLKVLSVFLPATYQLNEGFVACSSRGKVTIISHSRLLDGSRFTRQVPEPELAYGH